MSRLGPAIGWVSVALQSAVSCCCELPLDPVALVDWATIDSALPFRVSPTSTFYKIGFTFVVTAVLPLQGGAVSTVLRPSGSEYTYLDAVFRLAPEYFGFDPNDGQT